jgi:hypothetical protein
MSLLLLNSQLCLLGCLRMWYFVICCVLGIFEAFLLTTLLAVAHFLSPAAAVLVSCHHPLCEQQTSRLCSLHPFFQYWLAGYIPGPGLTDRREQAWEPNVGRGGSMNTKPFTNDPQRGVIGASSPSYDMAF